MGQIPAPRSSLANRLRLALAAMLLPAAAVAAAGLVTSRLSISALEEFRAEAVGKHGQGFLLGRPAPAEELTELLRTVNTGEVTVAARLARPR
jgi:hypothetical protein